MKKQLLLLAVTLILLAACGGNAESESTMADGANNLDQAVSEPVVADYKIDNTSSTADWERTLDQKPTKQKVKLFGKMVDVELGEVKLNTNGSVTITDGGLTTRDETITEATVVFDMASFKFAQEKGQGLFDVNAHPNSTLILNNFTDSTAAGSLTIQGANKEVDIKVSTDFSSSVYVLKGNFTVNTLDFPLREKVKEKDINKDEIKVMFTLTYK